MITGKLVHEIQKSTSSDEAVSNYLTEAEGHNLTELWVRTVFSMKRTIPILDELFDVHGKGETILTQMNVSPDIQKSMWEKWPTLPEDVRASWIQSFSKVDENDQQDVITFVNLLIKLLTT